MAKATGRVIQIQGSVVDVEFPEGELPEVLKLLKSRAGKAENGIDGSTLGRTRPAVSR
jgi:F0F1-type ATP synthase beta subunit